MGLNIGLSSKITEIRDYSRFMFLPRTGKNSRQQVLRNKFVVLSWFNLHFNLSNLKY